ncbi:hypothetical protein BDQ12DRAFT_668169 [Crucibulum laeve]|uniref:Uncharacterized protein n=1 Tax=Crucibulum laeve TaxID=68775 RepID=A0A5C3LUF2_9AGAR|nr:hypothetical protein BDQ12DRAFT_668169 [Crucibulum laeve]
MTVRTLGYMWRSVIMALTMFLGAMYGPGILRTTDHTEREDSNNILMNEEVVERIKTSLGQNSDGNYMYEKIETRRTSRTYLARIPKHHVEIYETMKIEQLQRNYMRDSVKRAPPTVEFSVNRCCGKKLSRSTYRERE